MAITNPTKYVSVQRLGRFEEKIGAKYATKDEMEAMLGPTYDEDEEGIEFPITSQTSYDAEGEGIIIGE